MTWEERKEVKKGSMGENIIDRYLISQGYVPYMAVYEGAHPFDRIVATPDKKNIYVVEVKTKARRTYYPDTGIDTRHYFDYKHVTEKYNMRMLIFFVDEYVGTVYGNFLDVLDQARVVEHKNRFIEYPLKQRGILYFPLCAMLTVAAVSAEESKELKKLSKRSCDYPTGDDV